jgi:hypothetical protein
MLFAYHRHSDFPSKDAMLPVPQKKFPVLPLGNFTLIDCGSRGQTYAMSSLVVGALLDASRARSSLTRAARLGEIDGH